MKIEFSFRHLLATALVAIIAGGLAGMFMPPVFYSIFGVDPQQKLFDSKQGHVAGFIYEDDVEERIVGVVRNASPAVVSIVIEREAKDVANETGPLFFERFGFPYPFDIPESNEKDGAENNEKDEDRQLVRIGGGSGFIVSSDGLIITNKHVIDDEKAVYSVALNDGKEYPAIILAKDPFLDVGILKIEATDLPVLKLGDSDSLKIGQTVIAIGNALSQYSNTVTRGVVSGIGRRVVAGDGFGVGEVIEEAIQTDAAINPGNSGGPLFNLEGDVVGIAVATSLAGESVSFAIPINRVKRIVNSINEHGRIVRAWLGVRYTLINKAMFRVNHLPVDHGALIARGNDPTSIAIIPGSPADKAGLEENNIILELNGSPINIDNSLSRMVSELNPGDKVTLKIFDDGEEREVEVELGEFPEDLE